MHALALHSPALFCGPAVACRILLNGSALIESTNSTLSDFHGPSVVAELDTKTQTPPLARLAPEEISWFDREFSTGPTSMGNVSGTLTYIYQPISLLSLFLPQSVINRYNFMSWDSMDIRVTCNDPKGAIGMWTVVVEPYSGATGFNYTGGTYGPYLDTMWSMAAINVAKSFGEPGDVMLQVPWAHRTATIPTTYVGSNTATRVGTQILQLAIRNLTYVSTIVPDPIFQIFVKFNGFKLYGPKYYAQSGNFANSLAGGFAAAVTKDIISYGTTYAKSALYDTFGTAMDGTLNTLKNAADSKINDYVNPVDIAPTYFGDTTSTEAACKNFVRPPTGPISVQHQSLPIVDREIDHYLQRPGFIGTYTGSSRFTNNILTFSPTSTTVLPTWFSYFANCARYWTGDLKLHVMVHGHPMVETRLVSNIQYRNTYGTVPNVGTETPDTFTVIKQDVSTFNGPKTFTFVLPFMSMAERFPITTAAISVNWWTTVLDLNLTVVSTMLDVSPTISYSVFVTAGDNFHFEDPMSPSSNAVYSQVLSPSPSFVIEPKLQKTNECSNFKQIKTLKDLMNCWSGTNFTNGMDSSMIVYPNISNVDTGIHDFLSWTSRLFLYRRGSIAYKVIVSSVDYAGGPRGIVGVALGASYPTPIRTVAISAASTTPGVPSYLDLGKGAVFTNPSLQPVLEFTIPYRGTNSYGYVAYSNDALAFQGDSNDATVDTNLSFISALTPYKFLDRLYRKAAHDYCMSVDILPGITTRWVQSF